MVLAISDFFAGANLPRAVSATLLTLIPKVASPQVFSDFWPISVCNVLYKIISKVLMRRLEFLLPRLISPQQSGFVRGRLISDNFLLAKELIQSLNVKVWGANIMFKLDMTKAYDRVFWPVLMAVMRSFGFCEVWIDMVWILVSGCHFSLLINGEMKGFF